MELKEGEKYITISAGGLKFSLFPNKEKKKETDPDFVGSIQLAAWVNKKKPKQGESPL